MSRPKKPQALHILHGTNRPDRDAARVGELVVPPGDIGDCPEWFEDDARDEWLRLVTDPHYSKVLASVHRGALLEYCVLYARMVQDAMGSGDMNSSQRQTLNSLRMQLGLTPASQSKVAAPAVPVQPEESPWEALKSGRSA